jgi:hypothetical protein
MDLFIEDIMKPLSKARPIFHSEADFQHAVAWEIHNRFPQSRIRLEYPPLKIGRNVHIDICCIIENLFYPIELKYKTRTLRTNCQGEYFKLLSQSAQDIGRYDFAKDLERLENIIEVYSDAVGYLVFLSNDSSYWKPSRQSSSIDADFRLHEDRVLTGLLKWDSKASEGTTKGRERSLNIKGIYKINWLAYSRITDNPYGEFRYIALRIENKKDG